MVDIADLGFRVDTSSLRAAIRELNGVGDSSKQASASLKGMVGTSAAAASAALALVTVVAQQTKQTDTLAKTLGISTGTLQEFHAAARTVGIESDKMGDIFKDLEDKIGEAFQEGTGEGAAALELLGLEAQDLINLPVDKKLEAIGQALSGVDSRAGQISIMEMLADDAALLLPLLDGNNEKLQEARARAIETGQALDDFDNTALVMVGQAMSDLAANTQGSANIFSAELAPAVIVAQRYITDMLDAFSKEDVEAFANFAVDAIGVLLDVVQSLEMMLRTSGVGWTMIAAAATGAMAESADAVASVINTVLRPLQLILAKVAEGWATITGALAKVTTGTVSKGFSAASKSLRDFSADAKAFSVSADDIRAGNDKVNKSLQSQIKALDELSNSPAYSDTFKARIAAVKVEIEAKSKAEADNRKGQQGLAAQLRLTTAEIEAQRKATEKADAEWVRWLEGVKDSIDPMRELEREAEKTWKALAAGDLSPEEARAYIDTLTEGFKKAAGEAESQFDDMANRVASTLQNAIATGDWQGVGQSIGGILAGEVGGQVAQSLGSSLAGLGAAAGPAGAVGGAIAGGFLQSLFAGGGFEDTAAIRQASQGTGTVLGSIDAKSESIAKAVDITASASRDLVGLNRGMLNALQSMRSGMAGASSRVARSSSSVDFGAISTPSNIFDGISGIGNAVLDLPVVNIVDKLSFGLNSAIFKGIGKLLGGSSKVTDEGVQIIGGTVAELIEETMVQGYRTVKSKKYKWSSSKTRESFVDLGDDTAIQFQRVFESLADSVYEGALALGFASDGVSEQINSFVIETQKISLKGLDAEKQSAEIEAVFSSIFDNLSGSVVDFLPDFQQAGEGLGETLARVATQVQVAEEAAFRLGFAAERVDPEQFAHLADGLIKVNGGIEQFIGSMSSFVEEFAPEAHKFEIASTGLEKALTAVGLSVPETAQGMWELMQSLDAADAEGQEQIATLLRVTDTSKAYYDALEKAAEVTDGLNMTLLELTDSEAYLAEIRRRELETLDESQQLIQERIWALQDEAKTAAEAAESLDELTNALGSFIERSVSSADQLKVQLWGLQGDTQAVRDFTLNEIMSQGANVIEGYKDKIAELHEQFGEGATVDNLLQAFGALNQQIEVIDENLADLALSDDPMAPAHAALLQGVKQALSEQADAYAAAAADMEKYTEGINSVGEANKRQADLQKEIWAEQDAQAAAAIAKQIADQRTGLLMEEYRALGDIESIRELELGQIHESNREIKERIWALQDSAQLISDLQSGMSDALAGLRKSVDLEISGIKDSYAAQIDAIKATAEAEDDLARQRLDDARQSIQSLKSLRSMLSGGIRALQDPDGATGRFTAAQDQIAQALAQARQGNLPTAEALESAMAGVSEYDRKMFDSAEDAAFQAAVTANQLKELDQIAGRQLSIEERTLEHLQESDDIARMDRESQIELLEQQRDNDIAAVQRQYDQMEAQVNALLGIDTSVKSVANATLKVEEAIKSLAAAEAARQQLLDTQSSKPTAPTPTPPKAPTPTPTPTPKAPTPTPTPSAPTPAPTASLERFIFNDRDRRIAEWVRSTSGFNITPTDYGANINFKSLVTGSGLQGSTLGNYGRDSWSAWWDSVYPGIKNRSTIDIPGFASGGYTGNVAADEIAGLVHGQEFVLNAAATRSIGVSALQAMNQGQSPAAIYGDGGSMVGRMVAAAVEGLRSEMRSALGNIAANTYQSAIILDNATRGGALATVVEQ